MKSIKYSITASEEVAMAKTIRKQFNIKQAEHNKSPHNYGSRPLGELQAIWFENALVTAQFQQLASDSLALIEKCEDSYYTFADHKGDCYCPITNSDIDPNELKHQERKERARFNRQGVWYYSLMIKSIDSDTLEETDESIGGFVGNDFYSSGYDLDFYRIALGSISEQLPEYFSQLNAIRNQITVDDLV